MTSKVEHGGRWWSRRTRAGLALVARQPSPTGPHAGRYAWRVQAPRGGRVLAWGWEDTAEHARLATVPVLVALRPPHTAEGGRG